MAKSSAVEATAQLDHSVLHYAESATTPSRPANSLAHAHDRGVTAGCSSLGEIRSGRLLSRLVLQAKIATDVMGRLLDQ